MVQQPTGLSIGFIDRNTLVFAWDAVHDATSYVFEYQLGEYFETKTVGSNTTTNTSLIWNLTSSVTMLYSVYAVSQPAGYAYARSNNSVQKTFIGYRGFISEVAFKPFTSGSYKIILAGAATGSFIPLSFAFQKNLSLIGHNQTYFQYTYYYAQANTTSKWDSGFFNPSSRFQLYASGTSGYTSPSNIGYDAIEYNGLDWAGSGATPFVYVFN
jgi:hypothetical protein